MIAALRILFFFYVLLIPFTSALSYSGSVFPPLVVAIAMVPFAFFSAYTKPVKWQSVITSEVIVLFFFICLVWLSYLVNGMGNPKSLNHAAAYSVSIFIYYISMKLTFYQLNTGITFKGYVLKLLTITVSVSACYACLEFVLRNFYSIDLGEYVPRGDLPEYEASVLELFQRARGFAVESGHFTFMLEMFSPIVFYYLFYSKLCGWPTGLKYFLVFVIIASIIFAVSAATFIIIPVVVTLTGIVYFKRLRNYFLSYKKRFLIATGVLACLVLILNKYFSLYFYIASSIVDKFDSGSYDDREVRYNFFYDIFPQLNIVQKVIGVGPSGFRLLGYDESVAILSLYFNVTFELGILGLALIVIFIFMVIIKCLRWKSGIAPFVFVGIVAGALHYAIIANYYYPWFWFICIFPFAIDQHRKKI